MLLAGVFVLAVGISGTWSQAAGKGQNPSEEAKSSCSDNNGQFSQLSDTLSEISKAVNDLQTAVALLSEKVDKCAEPPKQELSCDLEIFQSCYVFNTSREDWYGAKAQCQIDGGHLAIIETVGEYNSIVTVARTKANNLASWWIAANDIAEEGNWVWDGVNTPVDIDVWAYGEPNNRWGTEHCGEINGPYNFKLNDRNCTSKQHFICEYELD
jgi:hypothetical protein